MTSAFQNDYSRRNEPHASPPQIFQAVVEEDYDGLVKIFAENARNSVISYISMKSRWARQQDYMAQSGMLRIKAKRRESQRMYQHFLSVVVVLFLDRIMVMIGDW